MSLSSTSRLIVAFVAAAVLSACSSASSLDSPLENLGNFKLGHNIVVADNAQIGPLSRAAEPDDWEAAMTTAIEDRLGRYQGEGLFHLGVTVEGYNLAVPGVPLVVSPKSVLIISVNIWDNSTREKLTEEPKQFTVFEALSGETIVGSGLTQNKAQQMENLSINAAAAIERWLVQNPQWFGVTADAAEQAVPAAENTAATAETAN